MTSTTLIADIRDSKGTAIAGYLRVTLTAPLTIDGVTYQTVPATIPLVAGMATFTLVATDEAKIPYLFEIIKQSGSPVVEERIRSFEAIVYPSGTPVNLGDLDSTSGVANDSLYASLTAIVRKLYTSDQFWEQAQNEMFPHKGTYSSASWYRRGNIVEFQDNAYLYVAEVSQRGITPGTDTTIWHKMIGKGATGAGTTGSNAPYDSVGWLNNTDAPSKNAVRNIIETLATKAEVMAKVSAASPALTGTPTAPTAALNTNTTQIATTAFVQSLIDTIRLQLIPVGTVLPYAGTSAPTGFVMCDGRKLSRTTYAALFAVLGTAFNTSGETASEFRLPDFRGRTPVGLDNMSALMGAGGVIASLTTLGQKLGAATHTLTISEMPNHDHATGTGSSNVFGSGGLFPVELSGVGSGGFFSPSGMGRLQVPTTGLQGGGGAHNNLQPLIGMNWIIAAGV
jgi:microcystin-dependent protein